ncbi:MAG: formate dehydrogenase subunit gamma [Betaproteobacteria bacterium]|nr:formate dehydrogenase subunit gamma [Betaproteobacteria bacterium]
MMMTRYAKGIGAFVLALAAWLPSAATAQQPAAPGQQPAPAAAAPAPAPAPGSTAVPGWNNPPSWSDVSTKSQYASVPGRETNVLIQGGGREWRALRNGPVTFYGGIFLLIPFVILALFYLAKGPIKTHDPLTGRLIERFSSVERVAHWTMGLSFVVLALTGIVLLFGKFLILPIVGYAAFSTITVLGKNLHNFVGPLFIFSLVIFIVIFIRDNTWKAYDGAWLGKFGGLLSGEHVPSGRFNAGEKGIFWFLVVGLCSVMAVTGVILNFPNWNQGREAMQIANLIHGICAIAGMALATGHIYLGTIGMHGALNAMKTGLVDETWAREHHQYWYEEVKAGKRPEKFVAGTAQPATGD